jgi:DNA polymerase-1
MKSVGYGIIYGIGALKLSQQLTDEFQSSDKNRFVTEDEAQGYIDSWYGLFKGVKAYVESQKAYVKKHKQVQTFLGRYRRLSEIDSAKFGDRIKAERQAVNIIQGDAADIVRIAMLAIEDHPRLRELGFYQFLQIHDEVVGELPDDNEEHVMEAMAIVKDLMENSFSKLIFQLLVPLSVEINKGYTWAAAK